MTNPTASASGQSGKSPRRALLEEAADLIDGDRNLSYGTPTQNFTNIAELWNTRFAHMLADDAKFTAADVADAMILLKVARNIAQQKKDNWADIAGYAGCGYEATLEDEQPRTIFSVRGEDKDFDPVKLAQLASDVLSKHAARKNSGK